MRALKTFLLALCIALLGTMFIPGARAGVPYTDVPAIPSDSASIAANTPGDQPSQVNPADATSEDSQQPVKADQSQATQPQAAPSTDRSQAAQPQTAPSPSADQSNQELPKTASPTPLIGLIGMLSLGAALGLRQLAKRVS